VVSFEDTGIGMTPEFLPYAFERFRQADMGSRRRHGGLGLGLAIVRHIVELHGGTVEASSGGRDRGATFSISLPISLVRPAEASAVRISSSPPTSLATSPDAKLVRGLSILIIDDELDAREMLASLLSSCGASVATADSARGGLLALEKRRFDVIVSDIGMPDEDGYDFIERVRALPPEGGGRTPAIALTAYVRTTDRTKALLSGFNAHVTKPVDSRELLGVIAEVSDRPGFRA
jgi:CheY-like chemotaxis protein